MRGILRSALGCALALGLLFAAFASTADAKKPHPAPVAVTIVFAGDDFGTAYHSPDTPDVAGVATVNGEQGRYTGHLVPYGGYVPESECYNCVRVDGSFTITTASWTIEATLDKRQSLMHQDPGPHNGPGYHLVLKIRMTAKDGSSRPGRLEGRYSRGVSIWYWNGTPEGAYSTVPDDGLVSGPLKG